MKFQNLGKNDSYDIAHVNAAFNRATYQEFIPPNTFVYEFGDTRYEISGVEKIIGVDDISATSKLTNKTQNDITVNISQEEEVTLAPGESVVVSEEELTYVETTTPEVITQLTDETAEPEVDAEAVTLELTSFYGQGGPVLVPSTYDLPDGLAEVTFTEEFKANPAMFMLMGPSGGDAANVRYKDINTLGFKGVIVEPEAFDGPHAENTLPYAAILPGVHQFGDIMIEVGYIETKKVQGNNAPVGNEIGWDRVTLQNSFPNLGVIASIQTMNNETNDIPNTISSPWITPTVKPVSDNQFDITLDMSTTANGIVNTTEKIAYIAFSCGQTTTFTDNLGNTIKAETKKVTNIAGYSDGGVVVPFSNSYSTAPLTLASLNSRKDSKGGWLRYSNPTTTGVTLLIDHDTTNGETRNHPVEDAAVLTFSRNFNLKIV